MVLNNGTGLWQAACTSPEVEACRWQYAGFDWVEGSTFELIVTELGAHEVTLEVLANGCVATSSVLFTAVHDLRVDVEEGWAVAYGETAWTLIHDGEVNTMRWSLHDLSGRRVQRGGGETVVNLTVPHPSVSGLYWLVLEADGVLTRKRLFAP